MMAASLFAGAVILGPIQKDAAAAAEARLIIEERARVFDGYVGTGERSGRKRLSKFIEGPQVTDWCALPTISHSRPRVHSFAALIDRVRRTRCSLSAEKDERLSESQGRLVATAALRVRLGRLHPALQYKA